MTEKLGVKEAPEVYTNFVKDKVEEVLQTTLGQDAPPYVARLRGKLSTDPERVSPEIARGSFSLMCGTFSRELKIKLSIEGVNAEVVYADNGDPLDHVYLQSTNGASEVLIDPTIGQFLEGHNQVFVGGREQLRELVTKQTGEGKVYKIVEIFDKYSPEEIFELVWGSNSIPYNLVGQRPRSFLPQGFINREEVK